MAASPVVSPASAKTLKEALGGPGWLLGRPQRSPDGRWLAVERMPTGAETLAQAELWLADRDGNPLRILDTNGAYAPRWSPDSRTLAYLRAGTIWLVSLDGLSPRRLTGLSGGDASSGRNVLAGDLHPTEVLIPPSTIRVAHHPSNTCRDRLPWSIDVIPFEEYVRRVVPHEVPARWPSAVVRAQAIAARTYAWYHVLQGKPDFDVTDWVDYQVMCDTTHPASDEAVLATAGQYIAYRNRPILAKYSADHGHPTLDGGLPYLQAVPDPVSLGKPRRGHGHGMSQWGAYRWAQTYGWDELQILAHYYTGVEVRRSGERPPLRLGITDPWAGWYYGGRGVWLEANAAPVDEVNRVTFWADGRIVGEDTTPADGWGMALDFAQIGVSATLTVSAETISGTVRGENRLWLGVDQERPQGAAWLLPPTSPPPTITLGLTSSDGGLAGFAGMGVSAAWSWEGEDFQGVPGGPVGDPEAHNGLAWGTKAGFAGTWTSQPVQTLPVGRIYRALFRLRTGPELTSSVVARLEVTAEPGGRLLGLADVRGLHFLSPNAYQDIPVDFWYDAPASVGLRFRVRNSGAADLMLDRVLVVEYPTLQPPEAAWALPTGARAGQLIAVAFDRAGNASNPRPITLAFAEMPGPGAWEDAGPADWITDTTRSRLTITVWTPGGFEPAGSACRVSGDGGATWGGWTYAEADASAGAIVPIRLACIPTSLGEGESLAQFRAEDVHGRFAESEPFPVRVDTQPPLLSFRLDGQPGENGWFLGPVTITLTATDATSGIREIAWRTDDSMWQGGTLSIVVGRPGKTVIQARAVDHAGLGSQKMLTVSVDMAPPTARMFAPELTALPFFTVRWEGEDDAAGVVNFDVQVQASDASEWTDWLTDTIASEMLFKGRPLTSYRFRARARDAAGRIGGWSEPVHVAVVTRAVFLPMLHR
ncbi:MAG: SpoIID/LytB domain-containing protein [Anaerolineae bacterium]|nr:SpoIID/LytB domain-containing protein [Anaerolineae bacterium]